MKSQRKRARRTGQGPRIGHLDSLGGILSELQTVYREVRYGQTKPDVGTKLAFMLREMRAVLEAMALERIERRLSELSPAGGSVGFQEHDRPIVRPH